MTVSSASVSAPTEALTAYLAEAARTPLPEPVAQAARAHLLDTIAAMVSGSALVPGRRATEYLEVWGSAGDAVVAGTPYRAAPVDAALANGMAAHADETDDSHAPSLSHPGCAVVPAVLALLGRRRISGPHLLRAVTAGYDVGTRVVQAYAPPRFDAATSAHSTHAHCGVFGAASAAAVGLGLSATQIRHVLSYAAQSAAGITTWVRDPQHVEKAYVFGGMPAANGLRAATMIASGCDGVEDVFAGASTVLGAFGDMPDPALLGEGLGERFAVTESTIKKYAVGSPAQAPVEATVELIRAYGLSAATVRDVEIVLPHDLASVVRDRAMPDIDCRYLVAATLLDGAFSFAMAHDAERMRVPEVVEMVSRVRLTADPAVTAVRRATVVVTDVVGVIRRWDVDGVRGTPDNPMAPEEVAEKALGLMAPVLGAGQAEKVVDLVSRLDTVADCAALADLLASRQDPTRGQT